MSSLRILIIFSLFVQILINTPKITSNTSCRLVGEPSIPDEWHDGRRNNGLHNCFSLDKNVTNGGHLGAIRTSTKTTKRKYHRSRINRHSDTTRCSSIQLLKDSTVKQLILARDVSENPGPVPTQVGLIHSCSVCTKTVTARHRAVLCDTCQLWCHIKCGSISAKAYSKMMNTLDLVWVCPTCTNGNSSLSRPGPSHQEGQPVRRQ